MVAIVRGCRALVQCGFVSLFAVAVIGASCPSSGGDGARDTRANSDPLPPARGCPEATPGRMVSSEAALAAYAELIANPDDEAAFRAWKALLPTYGDYYVVDGDLLVLGPDLENFALRFAAERSALEASAAPVSPELHINKPNGRPGCWKADERPLNYTVDRATFCGDPNQECPAYTAIVEDIKEAASDWMEACEECGIGFDFIPDAVPDPETTGITFVVRQCEIYPTLGLAFFPGDGPDRRYVDIAPEALESRHTRVGILRHELGHVLGYRHEQLEETSGCFRTESGDWERISEYDPKSAMHYPCGKALGQNESLEVSSRDASDHRSVYTEICGL